MRGLGRAHLCVCVYLCVVYLCDVLLCMLGVGLLRGEPSLSLGMGCWWVSRLSGVWVGLVESVCG